MTDTAKLSELLEMVEAATGPDQVIDADLAQHVAGLNSRSRRTDAGVNKGREWLIESHGGVQDWARSPPGYTASIDAALALVERMLPDAYGNLQFGLIDGVAQIMVDHTTKTKRAMISRTRSATGQARTLPLAILACLLRTLSSDRNEHG